MDKLFRNFIALRGRLHIVLPFPSTWKAFSYLNCLWECSSNRRKTIMFNCYLSLMWLWNLNLMWIKFHFSWGAVVENLGLPGDLDLTTHCSSTTKLFKESDFLSCSSYGVKVTWCTSTIFNIIFKNFFHGENSILLDAWLRLYCQFYWEMLILSQSIEVALCKDYYYLGRQPLLRRKIWKF